MRLRKALEERNTSNMNKAKLVIVLTIALTTLTIATNSPVNAAVVLHSNGIIMNVVVDPPVITLHPVGIDVYETEVVNLSVTATGVGLSHRWRLGGVLLSDGVDANGTTISGALTPNLTLTTALGSYLDSGDYDCVVSNAIATVTSNKATVNIYTLSNVVITSVPVANAPVPPATDSELFVRDSTGPVVYSVAITPAGANPAPVPTIAQVGVLWNVEPLLTRNPYTFGPMVPVTIAGRVSVSDVTYTGDTLTFTTVLMSTDDGRYTCNPTVSAQ